MRREPDGSLLLDAAIKPIVLDPSVSFHLLPLAIDRTASSSSADAGRLQRKFDQTRRRAKGGGKKGEGPVGPQELIGQSWSTARGKRL